MTTVHPQTCRRSMRVPVVLVGKVIMPMRQRRVPVHVRMFDVRHPGRVVVLMVRVVLVFVRVLRRFVRMPVQMLLAQMQPHADPHQGAGHQ